MLALFQCRALELLLATILRARPTADAIYDNLGALLSNCLATASEASDEVADAVVAAVRAVVAASKDEDEQEPVVPPEEAARYLSRVVVGYSRSLSGVDAGSEHAHKELLALETQLAAAAQQDRNVQGQSIRETFQRRDLRSDALDLHRRRLAIAHELVAARVDAGTSGGSGGGPTIGNFREFLASNGVATSDDGVDTQALQMDDSAMEALTQQLQELHNRKSAELTDVLAKKKDAISTLTALKKKREALEAQLRAVNDEIEDTLADQHRLDADVAAIELKYATESATFDAEHQHVIRGYERKKQREQIEQSLDAAAASVGKLQLERSGVETLQAKQASCLTQHLDAVLNYFASELPCVKFMAHRAGQAQEELHKLLSEAEGYRALGVASVAKELSGKAETVQAHLEEDRQCLAALHKRDVEIVDQVSTLLKGDQTDSVDAKLLTEVQRHLDYVVKLHDTHTPATNGHSSSNGVKAAATEKTK